MISILGLIQVWKIMFHHFVCYYYYLEIQTLDKENDTINNIIAFKLKKLIL